MTNEHIVSEFSEILDAVGEKCPTCGREADVLYQSDFKMVGGTMLQRLALEGLVRQSGARLIAFNSEMYQTSVRPGATSYYRREDESVREDVFAEAPILTRKKLTGLIPVPRFVLNDKYAFAEFAECDAVEVLALREDLAFLRGSGNAGEPRGLANIRGAQKIEKKLKAKRIDDVVKGTKGQRVLSKWTMFTNMDALMETGIDDLVRWDTEHGMTGTYRGVRVMVTTQMPVWQVIIANMDEAIIGVDDTLRFAFSREASYFDGQQWISAYQKDQILMRVMVDHDFAHRRPSEIYVLGKQPRQPLKAQLLKWWRKLR